MTGAVGRMAACLAGHAPRDAWSSRLGWGDPPDDGGGPWSDLMALSDAEAGRWLAIEMACERARGMDARAAAAYLVGRLGLALGTWLVRLHHAGLGLRPAPSGVRARPRLVAWSHGGQTGTMPVFDLLIEPGLVVPAGPDNARAVGDAVAALMRPAIAAAHARSGLAVAALWRQLGDAVTGAFLEHGKAHGVVGPCMADARAAIAAPSPLWNRQVGFVELRLPADPAVGRPEACEWFRARGGCCRFHTMAGGEFCGTCVHRDPASRDTLLLAQMREAACPSVACQGGVAEPESAPTS